MPAQSSVSSQRLEHDCVLCGVAAGPVVYAGNVAIRRHLVEHHGDPGNERADRLATEAIRRRLVGDQGSADSKTASTSADDREAGSWALRTHRLLQFSNRDVPEIEPEDELLGFNRGHKP